MNPAELLSILSAKTNQFEKLPTGKPEITQQDILASLGMIHHRVASLLLRVKYAQQYNFIDELDRQLWLAIIDLWMAEKWPYPKNKIGQTFRRDMGRLALAETIWPHVCLGCHGAGFIVIDPGRLRGKRKRKAGQIEVCLFCQGSGRKRPTVALRAELMGMPKTTWANTWEPRYRDIQGMLDRIESIGLGSIKRRIAY